MSVRKASTKAAPPELNAHLKKILPYPPGKPIEEVQRQYGLKDVIKLASNENPLGPSPKAVKAMAAVAGEMNLYPDGGAFYLREKLAKRIGVTVDEIMLGNGSDEIVPLLAMAYLGPRRELITSQYSFVRYAMAAELVGAPARLIPMRAMRHDLDAIARAIGPRTAMVCLDLPCNPTGTSVGRAELERFLKKVPSRVIVVLDQAYLEFAEAADPGHPDGLALRSKFPNLVILRTFSKAYGLAGLRVGYAVARSEVVIDLDKVRPPFNANRMAQAAAMAALDDTAHLRRTIQANAKGLAQLEKGFRALGLVSVPSLTNFVLVDIGRDCRQAFGELLKLGVVTRPMAGYGLTTYLRISIGTAAENRRCLAAMREVLK